MAFADFLITTFTVRRITNAQDAVGGESGAWADHSTGNPGRIRQLSATEREILGREGIVSTHRLYCMTDVDITTKDRARFGSTDYDITRINVVQEQGEDHHQEIDSVLRT